MNNCAHKQADIEPGMEYVLSDGVIVTILRRTRNYGPYIFVCEDSCLNEAPLSAKDILLGRAKWPFIDINIQKFRPSVGVKKLSPKDGYYTILKQEGLKVLIQWENTGRLAYVSIPFIGNDNLRDCIEGNYVYSATYNNEIVYVGKGKDGRYLHCTSGSSHCYELNKLHFAGETVEVVIVKEGLTHEQAGKLEKDLIEEIRPAFNKMFNFQPEEDETD